LKESWNGEKIITHYYILASKQTKLILFTKVFGKVYRIDPHEPRVNCKNLK